MFAALSGKRTYIVSFLMVVYAVIGLYIDKVDVDSGTQLILEALAIAGLRSGIAKK